MSYAHKSTEELQALAENQQIVRSIMGEMTFFPLCCSTGVLKNLQAMPYTSSHPPVCSMKDTEELRATIENAQTVHDLIRMVQKQSGRFILPIEWTQLYALSLIYAKCTNGRDDGPSGGYNNYKAAQVTWFDRMNSDKRSGKRFNGYNITYSCDHLTMFLRKQLQSKWGQILVSKGVIGAHGARVRGCVYTPNTDYLGKLLNEELPKIKREMLAQLGNTGEEAWQIK
jgi:hypothetical protein